MARDKLSREPQRTLPPVATVFERAGLRHSLASTAPPPRQGRVLADIHQLLPTGETSKVCGQHPAWLSHLRTCSAPCPQPVSNPTSSHIQLDPSFLFLLFSGDWLGTLLPQATAQCPPLQRERREDHLWPSLARWPPGTRGVESLEWRPCGGGVETMWGWIGPHSSSFPGRTVCRDDATTLLPCTRLRHPLGARALSPSLESAALVPGFDQHREQKPGCARPGSRSAEA